MLETCTRCGHNELVRRVVPLTVTHGTKRLAIQDEQTFCVGCSTVLYLGDQISRHELAVAAAIREMDGLLSAEELRAIRLKYGLRQTDLEAMLSIGPKTWTRWERGKVPQGKAADTLIRVMAADPDVARRLMEWAKVDNPEATAIFAQIDADISRLAEANLRTRINERPHETDAGQMASSAIMAVREARYEIEGKAA